MGSEVIATLCEDMEFIKHVIWTIWDETCDDASKGQEMTWQSASIDIWVLISCGNKRIGVYRLRQFNGSTFQVCPNILPKYRNKYTLAATRAFYDFLLDNMPDSVQKFVGFVPECFENVISYTQKVGWHVEGKLIDAFIRNGHVYDTACVGITRKELSQWVQ